MNQNYVTNRLIKETVDKNQPGYVDPEKEKEEEIQVGNIGFTIKDEEGNPVQGVKTVLYQNDEETEYKCTTGQAGGCNINNVPYGDYVAKTEKEDYEESIVNIKVDSDSVVINITLEASGVIGIAPPPMVEEEGEF